MKNWKKIVYWIATIWLSLGMLSSGIVQLFKVESEIQFILDLGYPEYFPVLLGMLKILGVIAVLMPKFPVLKEWAYAGFFFTMLGAAYSHIAMDRAGEMFPAILLLTLTLLSYFFRPESRRVAGNPA